VDTETPHRESLISKLNLATAHAQGLSNNYEVIAILGREQALGFPFSVVILDGSQGVDESLLLAETIHTTPELGVTTILLMVRLGQKTDPRQLKEAGIVGCINKPVDPGQIAAFLSPPKENTLVPLRLTEPVSEWQRTGSG
jgi:CheY-like chemotaxis protein